jgi:hypothetical protein
MAEPPIPSVVAMLVCDQIITEIGTNKKSLIGVFDNFFSLSFPGFLPRLAVYVKMADAAGDYFFKLRVVKLKDETLIAEVGIQAHIVDVSQYGELALNLGSIPIPEPGKYEIQLYSGNEYLHRITINALLGQVPQGGLPSWPQPK